MKLTQFVFLLFLTTQFCFSQQVYRDSSFVYTLKFSPEDENGYYSVMEIHVQQKNAIADWQVIIPQENQVAGNIEYDMFIMEDVNFDGHGDIRMRMNAPFHYQNYMFYYYVFDPITRKFKPDEILNTANLGSPGFDPATKTITSHWYDGSELFGSDLYAYENGKLEHKESTRITSTAEYYVTEIGRPIEGKMVTVEKTEIVASEKKRGYVQISTFKLVSGELKLVKKRSEKGTVESFAY